MRKMLCVVCSSFSGSSRSLGICCFPKTKSVGANGRQPVPTESWPGSSPGPRISSQRGASKAEAVALAGAETRGKAEKRAVGWAGGAEWGTSLVFHSAEGFIQFLTQRGNFSLLFVNSRMERALLFPIHSEIFTYSLLWREFFVLFFFKYLISQ